MFNRTNLNHPSIIRKVGLALAKARRECQPQVVLNRRGKLSMLVTWTSKGFKFLDKSGKNITDLVQSVLAEYKGLVYGVAPLLKPTVDKVKEISNKALRRVMPVLIFMSVVWDEWKHHTIPDKKRLKAELCVFVVNHILLVILLHSTYDLITGIFK